MSQALAELVGVLALGVVVDWIAAMAGRRARVSRRRARSRAASPMRTWTVVAALQLLQAGDEREGARAGMTWRGCGGGEF
jgi:hypothetical protein